MYCCASNSTMDRTSSGLPAGSVAYLFVTRRRGTQNMMCAPATPVD